MEAFELRITISDSFQYTEETSIRYSATDDASLASNHHRRIHSIHIDASLASNHHRRIHSIHSIDASLASTQHRRIHSIHIDASLVSTHHRRIHSIYSIDASLASTQHRRILSELRFTSRATPFQFTSHTHVISVAPGFLHTAYTASHMGFPQAFA